MGAVAGIRYVFKYALTVCPDTDAQGEAHVIMHFSTMWTQKASSSRIVSRIVRQNLNVIYKYSKRKEEEIHS